MNALSAKSDVLIKVQVHLMVLMYQLWTHPCYVHRHSVMCMFGHTVHHSNKLYISCEIPFSILLLSCRHSWTQMHLFIFCWNYPIKKYKHGTCWPWKDTAGLEQYMKVCYEFIVPNVHLVDKWTQNICPTTPLCTEHTTTFSTTALWAKVAVGFDQKSLPQNRIGSLGR